MSKLSIRQSSLSYFDNNPEMKCPFCGSSMKFIGYCKKPPPEEVKLQRDILDFDSCKSMG